MRGENRMETMRFNTSGLRDQTLLVSFQACPQSAVNAGQTPPLQCQFQNGRSQLEKCFLCAKPGFECELVEPDGIEPTTSCLQSTRSPN